MWNSQSKEQQPQMWSTHDLACAHCRARKIRCGRERPQCESCKRDGVECRYSSPGKRINHVKLLCQNFEALEDQLNSIQGDLSALTSLVKNGNGGAGRPQPPTGDEWAPSDDLGTATTTDDEPAIQQQQYSRKRKDRHIVRDELHSIDRYHGPGSLYTLCREFADDPVFQNTSSTSSASGDGEAASVDDNEVTIRELLAQMCAEASHEEHLDFPSEHAGICLPPRQFLNIVVGQFFKAADYATDLFSQPHFQAQLDRVYAHPLGPADEAWAVCFNAIVLLAIGKDQTSQSNSPFIQPFLQTMRMAVNNPRVFLAPRLVNVQALALLSYIAEQYSPPGFADVIFAQACMLARSMGLHQCRATSFKDSQADEELLEKQKVFRSLYIRDKNFAICRGASAWLAGYDSSVATEPLRGQLDNRHHDHQQQDLDQVQDQQDQPDQFIARLELARLQDDVYRHFLSAEAPSLPPAKHAQVLSQLEQKLERWASTHQVTRNPVASADAASLALSFLATRLCILRTSDATHMSQRALSDAKISCLVVLLETASRPEPRLAEALDQLLGEGGGDVNRKLSSSASPAEFHHDDDANSSTGTNNSNSNSSIIGRAGNHPSQHHQNNKTATTTADYLRDDETSKALLPRLAASFPLAAVFQVARSVVQQPIATPDSPLGRPEEEMLLLETLRDRFAAAADQDSSRHHHHHHRQVENQTQKISRALDTLVRVVRQKRFPDAVSTPSMIFNDLSSLRSSASSASVAASQPRSSAGGSRRHSPPGPAELPPGAAVSAGDPATAAAVMPPGSLLLPFMQPLESPPSVVSPWHTAPAAGGAGAGTGGASNNLGAAMAAWASPYHHRHHQTADSAASVTGRAAKRPRLASQPDMFDITAAFEDHSHGQVPRLDDDPMSMFDFLTTGTEIPVFDPDD